MCFVSFPCKAAKQLKLNYLTWFIGLELGEKEQMFLWDFDYRSLMWIGFVFVTQSHCCPNQTLLSYQSCVFFSLENLWHKGEPMTLRKPAYCHLPFLWPLGGAVALHWGLDVPIDLFRKTKSFKEIHLRHFTYYLEGIILFPYLRKEEYDQLQNTAS